MFSCHTGWFAHAGMGHKSFLTPLLYLRLHTNYLYTRIYLYIQFYYLLFLICVCWLRKITMICVACWFFNGVSRILGRVIIIGLMTNWNKFTTLLNKWIERYVLLVQRIIKRVGSGDKRIFASPFYIRTDNLPFFSFFYFLFVINH